LLRRIFVPDREEITRKWRYLHEEELHNLYPSPNIRSDQRREFCGACSMVETKNAYQFLLENLKESDHLQDRDVGGRVILKMFLTEIGWEVVEGIHLDHDNDL
jgi:hypothetical protein